jgi:F-type H+-transporting ATPase subunit delta
LIVPREPLVVQNYARALLHVVQKENIPLQEALEESISLNRLLRDQPKLFVFLAGPHFREETKEKLVESVFKAQLTEIFCRFLQLLLRRDRIDHLIDILDEFRELVEAAQGLTMGTVTTAVPLNADEQNTFREKLESFCKLKFDLQFKVDEKLIGGVKVKYGDILMDTAISTYLGDLRQRLMETRLVF